MDSEITDVQELDINSSIEITGGDWISDSLGLTLIAGLVVAGGILAAPVLIGAAGIVAFNTL